MSKTPKAPAKTPEPPAFEDLSPWERMKEFTRRLVAVPKSELPKHRGKPQTRPPK